MLSIIICSRNLKISSLLGKNISETVGCDHEIIVIDNSEKRFSIFSAYNEAIRRARGNILVFMHDDILYKTKNWGCIVAKVLEDEKIGVVGCVGGHVLGKEPTSWWDSKILSGCYEQKDGDRINKVVYERYNATLEPISVAAIDGLWMCFRNDVFNKIRWDEDSFTGFHFYDMDICMQIHSIGMEVKVIYDVLIEHESMGRCDEKYFEASYIWFNKWKDFLPIISGVSSIVPEVHWYNEYVKEKGEKNSCLNSHAYRLGCFLLQPVYWIKKKLKRTK